MAESTKFSMLTTKYALFPSSPYPLYDYTSMITSNDGDCILDIMSSGVNSFDHLCER
ncbi:hypothetical protein PVAP13_2NG288806 [Panicum virgatum]|uniref:Uncharacterized protein n=1 Tax=Panicum virgatum TaxID=38727 RepID=A0A8T0VCX5_PANVG|nr:hypothetical protein PVAP13_2NG288806 [Panicum virgatum]